MDLQTSQERGSPIHFVLSREELLLVLGTLQVSAIPGLDEDPLGELTAEGQRLALTVAERSLRARELARIDGQLVLHELLLRAVGACAYSEQMLFLYHWPGPTDAPIRYFAHIRRDDIVAHTRPDEALHHFTLLPSAAALAEQVLAACQCHAQGVSARADGFTLSRQEFIHLRELVEANNCVSAESVLIERGAAQAEAHAFVRTLAGAPRVSVLQTVKQITTGQVDKRDFTLIHTDQQLWLLSEVKGSNGQALLRGKHMGANDVRAMLVKWVVVP